MDLLLIVQKVITQALYREYQAFGRHKTHR